MCKLSIIIPTYNIQKNKQNCIETVLKQKMENYEVLFVDDGSTDETKKILNQYAEKYPNRIRIIYKQHTGVADTRNVGINNAVGKYIQFVDCDDKIEPNLLQNLEKYIDKNIDIIKFKLKIINNEAEEKIEGPVFESTINGQEAFNILYKSDVLLDSPCVYIFKKEIFDRNNLKFKINTEHEDFGLIPLTILYAKTMISIPIYGYLYIQSEGSIIRNKDRERLKKQTRDLFIHYDNMIKQIEKINLNEETKQNVKIYYTNAILEKLRNLDNQELEEFEKDFKVRKMQKNIKARSVKQLIKRIMLGINIKWYLDYQNGG